LGLLKTFTLPLPSPLPHFPPIRGHHFGHKCGLNPHLLGGGGEELTTKPTLFKYFDLVYINGLFM